MVYCVRKINQANTTRASVSQQSFLGLLSKKWCGKQQPISTIRRTAKLLEWDVPAPILELSDKLNHL